MELQEYLFAEIKNKLEYMDEEYGYSLESDFVTGKDSTIADFDHLLGRLMSNLRQYMRHNEEILGMIQRLEEIVNTAQDNSVSFGDVNFTDDVVKIAKNVTEALSDEDWKELIRVQKRFEKLEKEVEEETAQ